MRIHADEFERTKSVHAPFIIQEPIMITPENNIRLCDDCPNRAFEGLSSFDPVTGDLVGKDARYLNARLEFIGDPNETPDVPAQEYATRFIDTEGNKTAAFLPGVQLEEIATCEGPVVTGRSGFLSRKKHYDCGAQAVRAQVLREKFQR